MGTDFTERLRRALALRHTPEGRRFLGALVGAVSPEDATAADAVARFLADPAAARAPSLDLWLRGAAAAARVDPERVLAHRDRVAAALAEVRPGAERSSAAVRARAREALRAAVGLD